MPVDRNAIENLIRVVAREAEWQGKQSEALQRPQEEYCRVDAAEGLRVKTCFDASGRVTCAEVEPAETEAQPAPRAGLAGLIDHTLLKPEATPEQIRQLCEEAASNGFAAVCVNAVYVPLCVELLKDSPVRVASTIGFPLGATTPEVKAFETRQAVESGASEVDMVLNVGALKSKNYELAARDIRGVVEAAHAGNAQVKVILETALLTDEEKVIAALLAKQAGADYVKTSTGFSGGGATVEDVALMRRVVGPDVGVKAAGGVRTYEDAQKMVAAGATRLGTSSGMKLIQGQKADAEY